MMTKKHFEQFAELVRTTPGLARDTSFMSKLVGILGGNDGTGGNPRFDAKRFFKACEPEPGRRIRKLHHWICAECSRVLHSSDEYCPNCGIPFHRGP